MAACNIGGITLHSFSGIGLGEGSAEKLAEKIRKQKKAASRWMRTQVLIIDESEPSNFITSCTFRSCRGFYSLYGGWRAV